MRTHTTKQEKRRRRAIPVGLILFLVLCAAAFLVFRRFGGLTEDLTAGNHDPFEAAPTTVPEGYVLRNMNESEISKGALVLVNGGHPWSTADAPDLVSIYDNKDTSYFVRDMNVLIDRSVMTPLNELMRAFYEATGIDNVNIVSGYRSYDEQQNLYNTSVREDGAAHAAMFVAQPGCSEHHTGLAVDFAIYYDDTGASDDFDGSGAYGWMTDTGWQYGFILRYPESKSTVTNIGHEPWHYRYVGAVHAFYMKEQDLCLEEYISLLYQYPYDGDHLNIECLGKSYEIYYCPGTAVYVPGQGVYTVSGNNIDGFIVTAVLSG